MAKALGARPVATLSEPHPGFVLFRLRLNLNIIIETGHYEGPKGPNRSDTTGAGTAVESEEDMSDHQPTESHDDRLLFSTENGWVRHCACRDILVLHFGGHWMALTRLQYRDFHARLISTVRCPSGQRQLNTGGRFAFRSSGRGEAAFSLDREGMEELLWLLDSARFMLEARDAAERGYSGFARGDSAARDHEYREERKEDM